MACCRTLVLGLRDFVFCFFHERSLWAVTMYGFSSSPFLFLLGYSVLLRNFSSFHFEHSMTQSGFLYIEGLITLNEKSSAFIYDSFTLEVSNLSRRFTLYARRKMLFLPWWYFSFLSGWSCERPHPSLCLRTLTCTSLLFICPFPGDGSTVMYCAFWSGSGRFWLMTETEVTLISISCNTTAILPCCSSTEVRMPS